MILFFSPVCSCRIDLGEDVQESHTSSGRHLGIPLDFPWNTHPVIMKPSSSWGAVNAPNRSTAPGVFARPGLNGTSHRDFTTKTWGIFGVYTNRLYESWLCPKMRYPPKMAVEWGIHQKCMKHDTFSRTLYMFKATSFSWRFWILRGELVVWLKISDIPWADLKNGSYWLVRWIHQLHGVDEGFDEVIMFIGGALNIHPASFIELIMETMCMQKKMVPFVSRTMVQRV